MLILMLILILKTRKATTRMSMRMSMRMSKPEPPHVGCYSGNGLKFRARVRRQL
jgi:hypothetical protein